jgi:hypothetical protein
MHCSVSLEPGARIKHETPGHPSRDVFRQATMKMANCDSTVSGTASYSPAVLGTAITALRHLATPAQS